MRFAMNHKTNIINNSLLSSSSNQPTSWLCSIGGLRRQQQQQRHRIRIQQQDNRYSIMMAHSSTISLLSIPKQRPISVLTLMRNHYDPKEEQLSSSRLLMSSSKSRCRTIRIDRNLNRNKQQQQYRGFSYDATNNTTFDATRFTDSSSLVQFHVDDIITTPYLQTIIEQKRKQTHQQQHDDDHDDYDMIDGKIGTITINSPKTYNALTIEIGIEFQALIQRIVYELQYNQQQKPSSSTSTSQRQKGQEKQYKNNENLTNNSTGIINDHTSHHHHDMNESIFTLSSLNAYNIQVLIIKGEGNAFSAGGNLEWLYSLRNNTIIHNKDLMIQFYNYYIKSIQSIPIPIIAAINGPAMGAGACLALLCDLRTGCNPYTKLGLHFNKLGIHSGLGGAYLLSKMTQSSTILNEILLLGKVLNGIECLQYNIINQLHDNDALIPAYELAYDMITQTHPIATRMLLQTLRLQQHNGICDALERDAICQAICYNQNDWGEGLNAISQKRTPNFQHYLDYYKKE